MECFRYGFNFPSIQKRATVVTNKVLGIKTRRPRRFRVRPRVKPMPPPPPPPPRLKKYTPPIGFSIELDNMFEILDF